MTFFNTLLHEHVQDVAAGADVGPEVPDAPGTLPIPWLARLVHRLCAPLPFDIEAATLGEINAALAQKIAE